MMDISLNYWAVLAAAVSNMVIGFLWYGPIFGKTWMRLMNFTKESMEAGKAKNMATLYVIQLVGSIVMSYVLAHFVAYMGVVTFADAAMLGFWIWLGFIGTVTLGSILWEGKSWSLWILNNAYQLVVLIVAAGILSMWQ